MKGQHQNIQAQLALESGASSILNFFGSNAQTLKTCEELSELNAKLCKRANGSPVSDNEIIDEIADVLICVTQMKQLFDEEVVNARIVFKLERTMTFIRTKNKERGEVTV